jgi:Flp pilus assembly protein TadG
MTYVSTRSALHQPLRRFALDQDGVSAVEFALLLPLMLTLYLGGVEVSQAVSADRKTMLAAHTVGDLVSQSSCVSSATDIPNYFLIANEVIYPFSSGNLAATVTGVNIAANGTATVDWSQANKTGVTVLTRGTDVSASIPSALRPTGTGVTASYVIWAQASYVYTPTIGRVITGSLTLSEQIFLRPRQPNSSGGVTYQSAACS